MKEVGGEEYILSAVLHADKRNKVLSEALGRDVYHFHLHIVYVPVVEKREYFRQKKGEAEGERKLKAVYTQVSHAKKWPLRVPVERDGKTVIVNSYSLLQDRYFEHMRAAGFDGFERGERGSTAEYLEVLEYKIQQDKKRATELDKVVTAKQNQVTTLEKDLKSIEGKVLASKQIDKIPVKISRPIVGGSDKDTVTLSKKDWDNVKKTALTQSKKDEEYRVAFSENAALKKEKSKWRKDEQGYIEKVKGLERRKMDETLERAGDKADLHNLRNAIARIPKDIWDMYTRPQRSNSIKYER
ncbi:MAG: plasmid recombination protein [Oscillospiraceae bacterium]|nr:plasmid recombination protein [Oscillospiraceae bacterium]